MLCGFSYLAWLMLAVVLVVCAAICWVASQPGQRRRRQDTRYQGPDRRDDTTVTDPLAQPIFTRQQSSKRDKIDPNQ